LARRNTPHSSDLGKYRWVIERAESWLHKHRSHKLHYQVRDDIQKRP
jgi:hypothetical protein